MVSSPSRIAHRRKRWLLVAAVAATVVAGTVWFATRTTPQEQFRHGLDADANGDLHGLEAAAAALEDEPGYEPHRHLLQGILRLRKSDLRQAVELFGQATEHPETQAQAYALAGEAFYKLGRPDEARRALVEAVRLNPENLAAQRWLAAAYYDQGLMSEALPHLRKVGELAPKDFRPHRLRGLILKDFERYEDAVAAYRDALERDPLPGDAAEIRIELAECLIKVLQPGEALHVLAPAPPVPDVLALRAEAKRAEGETDTARTLLAQALEQNPNHARALTVLGTLELESGRAEAAVRHLERAAQGAPADVAIQHRLAQAYRLAGRTEDAERQTRRLVALQNLRTRFTELHEQAMAAPEDAAVRYELGQVATELRRPDLAAMWFQAALAIDPNHQPARNAMTALAGGGTATPSPTVPQ